MGNRRMGAQRLASLMKQGVRGLDLAYKAGPAAKNYVVSSRLYKEWKMRMIEVCIDLGSANGADIVPGGANDDVFHESGKTTAANFLQWEDDVYGRFMYADTFITEALASGGTPPTTVSIRKNTSAIAGEAGTGVGSDVLAGITANAVGGMLSTRDWDGADNDQTDVDDGDYLHLTHDDNSTATKLTGGRLVIRLFGIDNSWTFDKPDNN